jgi:membrane-associated phospholipid phosphatase
VSPSSLKRSVLCLVVLAATWGRAQTAQTTSTSSPRETAGENQQALAADPPPDSSSQTPKTDAGGWLPPGNDPDNRLISPFVKHLVGDQKQFWTAPAHLRVKDLKWIVPFTSITAAFIASDSWWSKQVPASHVSASKTISDYATYSFLALSGSSFLFGHITHDDHLSETGLLAGEAAIDATGVAYAFKEVTQRERPFQDDGNGTFFAGGSSFPAEHAAIAWSVASVWAHEYPGWLSQMAAYGLASTVSVTRVTGKQHFPSDVIIGSALGWYFGREVYRAHHDPELGGSGWGNLVDDNTGEKPRNPAYMASPYVPLDSWVYPALERLIALGFVRSEILGMRPWTRMQCARLLQDASDKFPDNGVMEGDAGRIYAVLTSEFAPEAERLDGAANLGARVDSIYTREMGISGTPLRDGYHFGQTIINDYGRPYWEGFNDVTGVIADAETGPISFFVRGEYQHAPAMPSYSPQVQNAVAAADFTPPLANGTAQYDRVQLLESMASVNIDNLQISVGNQTAWLAPNESGSLLMSNNAAPFPMVKIEDVVPREMPGLSRILGPFRAEFFVGQLSGQHWEECDTCPDRNAQNVVGPNISPQPFIHGEKISFQPTPNFEFGMGITAMFGGPGLPVTFGNFVRTLYAHSSVAAKDPGKRISAADLSYRIPYIRNYLTFYLDSLVVDEVSPIGSTRANVSPGIYMPQFPKLSKLQLRAEGINETHTNQFSPGFVYYDLRRFRSGYTNDGNLLGSWIGREGRGGQGWLTYALSPKNSVALGYRLQNVSKTFIEGGRLADYSLTSDFKISNQLAVSGLLQYEQWHFPILAPGMQSNITASVQLTYHPNWRIAK